MFLHFEVSDDIYVSCSCKNSEQAKASESDFQPGFVFQYIFKIRSQASRGLQGIQSWRITAESGECIHGNTYNYFAEKFIYCIC